MNKRYTQGGVQLLSRLARLSGQNHVRFAQHEHGVVQFDIVAMNRSVGHHFQWQIDGHKRKCVRACCSVACVRGVAP